MLPRFLVYHYPVPPHSAEDALWIERERRLLRIIINPTMILTWVLGLMLAFNLGWCGAGWLHANLAIVLGLSGYHGWLSTLRRSFAKGERPLSEKVLRLANELPGEAVILIVRLARKSKRLN